MNLKSKKTIAREGLLLILVSLLAFIIADSNSIKSLMMDIGIVKPRWNEAAAVLAEARRAGLYFLILIYAGCRFTVWAIKMLKAK